VSLERMCRMVPAWRCREALVTWGNMAKTSPLLAQVNLPRN
jgi:hypothetical protein